MGWVFYGVGKSGGYGGVFRLYITFKLSGSGLLGVTELGLVRQIRAGRGVYGLGNFYGLCVWAGEFGGGNGLCCKVDEVVVGKSLCFGLKRYEKKGGSSREWKLGFIKGDIT